MQLLRIPISTKPTEKPSSANATRLMHALLSLGFDEIDLTNLAMVQAQLRDGSAVDSMPLRVEEDAAFLFKGWEAAEQWGVQSKSEPHRAYLSDGCFEISAIPVGNGVVQVRVGEFRSEQDWLERAAGRVVTMTVLEYICIWRSVAHGLLAPMGS